MTLLARRFGLPTVLGLAMLLVGARSVNADTLDCTSGSCSSVSGIEFTLGTVDYASFAGALWSTTDNSQAGSFALNSFVQIGPTSNGVVDGMNTSARPLQNNENIDPALTRDLKKSEIPIVELPSVTNTSITGTELYYQFLLDINQSVSDPLLSMSQVKICTGANGGLASIADTCDDTGSASNLRYNLDDYPLGGITGPNNNIRMNDNLRSAGSGDLFMYIPVSYLAGTGNTAKYVYLWSQFGTPSPDQNNEGYEQWALKTATGTFNIENPEPASLMLLGSGLVIGSGILRRRFRKPARTEAPKS